MVDGAPTPCPPYERKRTVSADVDEATLAESEEREGMGAGGEDLIMARAAREKFPYSIECKNQETLNVWKAYEQAEFNSGDYEPVVFIKRNNQKPLVVIDAEYFIRIHDD